MKSACAGIKPKDLASILLILNLEKSWNPSYAKNAVKIEANKTDPYPNNFDSEELYESMMFHIKQIEYFSKNPRLQSKMLDCKKVKLPVTCLTTSLLPEKCQLSSVEVQKYLTSLLLGQNSEAEMVYKMRMDEDPASFLHLFSKEALKVRPRRSHDDKVRYEACKTFVLN